MTKGSLKSRNNFSPVKQKAEQIFKDLPDPLIVIDLEGNVLLANSTSARVVDMSVAELLKSNLKELTRKGYYDKTYWSNAKDAKRAIGGPFLTRSNLVIQSLSTPILHEDGTVKIIINSGWVKNCERESLNSRDSHLHAKRLQDLEYLRSCVFDTEDIVAESLAMRQALLDANSVAHVNCTTILYGESGVGKEVVAKYIHSHSRRSQGPFIAVNCAALPEQLIESELFGYEKGAFSGASPDGKIGLFEAAHKGTLLLDEIAEFPLSLQAKLLRTLETGEVRRVGSNKNYKIDFRLIAATHRDLREMCEKGLFRTDLFYRLNVVSIKIPPLRERREDISALVRHFLAEFEKKYEMHTVVGSEILEYFAKCDWPDNARELRNAVEKLVVMSGQKNFSEYLTMPEAMLSSDHYRLFRNIPPQSLKEARQNFEEQYIINALNICGGRLGETSKYLGVSRRFLYRKIKAMEEKKNIANYPNLSAHQKSTFPSKITELILAESERDKGNKI